MVSVWIGNFASNAELDDYLNLSRNFEHDFGFELNERDMPEVSVKPEPMPMRHLVSGFSWSDSYAQNVIALAQSQGIERATTMVVFFNFQYQPERAKPEKGAPLKFLGAVPFS
jgi:immunity protein 22 of polymorphic toxin system